MSEEESEYINLSNRITNLNNNMIKINQEINQFRTEYRREMFSLKENYIEEIKITINQFFENKDILQNIKKDLQKKTYLYITQEIKSKIGSKELTIAINDLVRQRIDSSISNIKPLISEITERIISQILKKYTKELDLTKQLCYSIDAEINHTFMKIGLSPTSEEKIIERINKLLSKNNINEKLLLTKGEEVSL